MGFPVGFDYGLKCEFGLSQESGTRVFGQTVVAVSVTCQLVAFNHVDLAAFSYSIRNNDSHQFSLVLTENTRRLHSKQKKRGF
jgi:hypothetical protein